MAILLKINTTMTRKSIMMFVMVMVSMVCFGQDNLLGINLDEVQVVRVGGSASATTAAPTRTVRQLSAANNRTASRRTATRRATTSTTAYAANQTAQNDMQSQLQAAAAASSMQVVVCGVVESCTPCGTHMRKMRVRSTGLLGGIRDYTLVGYQYPVIKINKGDYLCFIATDNGAFAYPQVNYSEVINSTGMTRYMNEYYSHHLGGGMYGMYGPYDASKMSKWNKVINGVVSGAYAAASVASVIGLIKSIF
jgi:hypothetical protein